MIKSKVTIGLTKWDLSVSSFLREELLGKFPSRSFQNLLNAWQGLKPFTQLAIDEGSSRRSGSRSGDTVVNDSPGDCQSRDVTEPQRDPMSHFAPAKGCGLTLPDKSKFIELFDLRREGYQPPA